MIYVGTDITEVGRIKEMAETHPQFVPAVFTEGEIAYCRQKRNSPEHFAARFAAKESVMKAVGKGWLQGLEWTDIEVVHLPGGAPAIKPHDTLEKAMREKGIASFAVSLSHSRQYAVATVIATSKKE